MPFHPIDVIQHKRDGLALTSAEIHDFIRTLVSRTPDHPYPTDAQAAALLMAIFLRGLAPEELAALTQAMRDSGETLDTTSLPGFRHGDLPPSGVPAGGIVDKHSTGGVGDKTSLLIAPIAAAAGLYDPMISGRSLGHTGGTLDKLETIPGFRTQLPLSEMLAITRQCGFAMAGQTPALVPADRILYALRDHTGTVESPYLITASIMSKKLAAGLNALVLDVKTGTGAFMKKYEDAQLLARLMVSTGNRANTRTVAVLTSMDQPLGRFAGNWVEVQECLEILQNRPHPLSADLIQLTHVLAGHMLHLGGKADTPEAGAALSAQLLASGAAYQHFLQMVDLQTTPPNSLESVILSEERIARAVEGPASSRDPNAPYLRAFANPAAFHKPKATLTLTAETFGYLTVTDCTEIGWAVQRLGAGRARPDDPVSAHAGLELHAKSGATLTPGQPIVTLFADDATLLTEPAAMLRATLRTTPTPPPDIPLIQEIISEA